MEYPLDGQRNMDMDVELGQQVAQGFRPPLIRVWRAGEAFGIGVSKKDVASDQGRSAMTILQQEGCDVVVRQTGGTAVPQGAGVLHVSYLFPRTAHSGTTDTYYRMLCNPLLEWLTEQGIQAHTGALPGSYCDGTYNVVVGGQKLVGTAQAWKGGLAGIKSARPGYILAHACLTVDIDMEQSVHYINRFYKLSGDAYRVDLGTATTLRQRLPEAFTGLSAAEANERVANQLLLFYQDYVTRFPPEESDGFTV